MNDPKPTRILIVIAILVWVLSLAWWFNLSAATRASQLQRIQQEEAGPIAPPPDFVGQLAWLITHRASICQGWAGLMGLGLLIGTIEGYRKRRQDTHGGFLLTWWTCGVIFLGILPVALLWYVTIPVVLPAAWVAAGLVTCITLGSYGVVAGRPYIP